MKPLNESSKQNAKKKFLGIYMLSVITILLLSFFLFSSPVKIFKEEARNFSEFKSYYNGLLKKTAMINTQVNELLAVKQAINSNPAPGLDSLVQKYISNINKEVTNLRNDSANGILKPFKNDMANYLTAYNAVLYYSAYDIENRHAAFSIPQNQTATASNSTLQMEYARLKIENKRLTDENSQLRSAKPVTLSSNDDIKTLQLKLTQSEKDKNDCTTRFAKASDDLITKENQLKEKDDQITKINASIKNNNFQKLTEEEKALLIFNNVDMVVEKEKAQKNGVFAGLITALKGIQSTYPDKSKLENKIKEIQRLKPAVF